MKRTWFFGEDENCKKMDLVAKTFQFNLRVRIQSSEILKLKMSCRTNGGEPIF